MDMVQCPSCENELALTSEKEMEDEVIEGKLTCLSCCQEFPIQKSIPNFLPPVNGTVVSSILLKAFVKAFCALFPAPIVLKL